MNQNSRVLRQDGFLYNASHKRKRADLCTPEDHQLKTQFPESLTDPRVSLKLILFEKSPQSAGETCRAVTKTTHDSTRDVTKHHTASVFTFYAIG